MHPSASVISYCSGVPSLPAKRSSRFPARPRFPLMPLSPSSSKRAHTGLFVRIQIPHTTCCIVRMLATYQRPTITAHQLSHTPHRMPSFLVYTDPTTSDSSDPATCDAGVSDVNAYGIAVLIAESATRPPTALGRVYLLSPSGDGTCSRRT